MSTLHARPMHDTRPRSYPCFMGDPPGVAVLLGRALGSLGGAGPNPILESAPHKPSCIISFICASCTSSFCFFSISWFFLKNSTSLLYCFCASSRFCSRYVSGIPSGELEGRLCAGSGSRENKREMVNPPEAIPAFDLCFAFHSSTSRALFAASTFAYSVAMSLP